MSSLSNLFYSLVSGRSSTGTSWLSRQGPDLHLLLYSSANTVGNCIKRQILIGNQGSWFLLHTEKSEVFSRASGGCRTERAENQGSGKADKYETRTTAAQLCPADLLSHCSFIFDLNLDVNATKPRSLKAPTVLCPCRGRFWSPASPPRTQPLHNHSRSAPRPPPPPGSLQVGHCPKISPESDIIAARPQKSATADVSLFPTNSLYPVLITLLMTVTHACF